MNLAHESLVQMHLTHGPCRTLQLLNHAVFFVFDKCQSFMAAWQQPTTSTHPYIVQSNRCMDCFHQNQCFAFGSSAHHCQHLVSSTFITSSIVNWWSAMQVSLLCLVCCCPPRRVNQARAFARLTANKGERKVSNRISIFDRAGLNATTDCIHHQICNSCWL